MSADSMSKGVVTSELIKLSGVQAEGVRIQRSINNDLEEENRRLRREADEERRKSDEKAKELRKLTEERDRYKNLLAKPMAEIAEKNANFQQTYNKQMELMAEWMVSQKAFKELALQFGFEKGLEKKEILEIAQHKRLDVLDNKHTVGHGTNANEIPLLEKEEIQINIKEKVLKVLNNK